MTKSEWFPTRKWMVRSVIAIGGLATMYFSTGTWDAEESIATVAVCVGALTAYLTPNAEDEPTTTPAKK